MIRIGHGHDVHKLVIGRKLFLGGVHIPYKKGLLGHSDADVLIHAVMDSLLGAAALRDIGNLFPDNDEKYKGISSMLLLKEVHLKLTGKGYAVNNIDATIIAQKPKLASYIDEMINNIANTLNINADRINIKATTTEGLGFAGREEGIAAHAVCTIKQLLVG